MGFTHFDNQGNAIMVDISEKQSTSRTAVAKGTIKANSLIVEAILQKRVKKGDVLGVARIAGIMGVKQTAALIPMCHNLCISKCEIEFDIDEERSEITVFCTVKVEGKTGVEMEALTGVNIALLTIYDMCKAVDKNMVLTNIHLVRKNGGKSGDFYFAGGSSAEEAKGNA